MFAKCLGKINKPYPSTIVYRYASNRASLDTYINSRISITAEQKQSYAKNGFIIIRNALSKDQLEIWRSTIDNAVNSRGDDHVFPVKGQMDTVNAEFEYYKNVFIQRVIYIFRTISTYSY